MNVPFETAKKLKDVGICLFCDSAYVTNNNQWPEGILIHNQNDDLFWFREISSNDYVYAPTIDDVIKYFRDESMYNIIATHYWYKSEMCWQYTIYDLGFPPSTIIISETNGEYDDWEDAIIGAINRVLDELIYLKLQIIKL